MALSNIFNEPRREITESVVGIGIVTAIVSVAAIADYRFAVWAQGITASDPHGALPLPVGLLVGFAVGALAVPALGLAVLLAEATHILGESICDALQRRGVHLRPRERR